MPLDIFSIKIKEQQPWFLWEKFISRTYSPWQHDINRLLHKQYRSWRIAFLYCLCCYCKCFSLSVCGRELCCCQAWKPCLLAKWCFLWRFLVSQQMELIWSPGQENRSTLWSSNELLKQTSSVLWLKFLFLGVGGFACGFVVVVDESGGCQVPWWILI